MVNNFGEALVGGLLGKAKEVGTSYQEGEENKAAMRLQQLREQRLAQLKLKNFAFVDPSKPPEMQPLLMGMPENTEVIKVGPSTIKPEKGSDITWLKWGEMPVEMQNIGKAIHEGKINPTSLGFRQRTAGILAAQAYGDEIGTPFYSYEGAVKEAKAKEQATGQTAKTATSLNTVAGHLDSLQNEFKNIGNTGIALVNMPLNAVRSATGNIDIGKLKVTLNAVKNELATVFKNTGATDQEIKAWTEGLSPNLTPEQADATIGQLKELIQSRLDALKYQQGDIMSPGSRVIERQYVSPKSEKIFNANTQGTPSIGGTFEGKKIIGVKRIN